MMMYNELYHHGILGMRWGVRRYQNPDGSLTAAGEKRYGGEGGKYNKAKDDYKIAKKEYDKSFSKMYNRAANHPIATNFTKKGSKTYDEAASKAHEDLRKMHDAKKAYKIEKEKYKAEKEKQKIERRIAYEKAASNTVKRDIGITMLTSAGVIAASRLGNNYAAKQILTIGSLSLLANETVGLANLGSEFVKQHMSKNGNRNHTMDEKPRNKKSTRMSKEEKDVINSLTPSDPYDAEEMEILADLKRSARR